MGLLPGHHQIHLPKTRRKNAEDLGIFLAHSRSHFQMDLIQRTGIAIIKVNLRLI